MTIEPTDPETDLDLIPEIPEELGQGEIQFTPTGIRHKDMAIAGMINDAPKACKALIKAGVWDAVTTSPNPAGKAEVELLKILQIPEDKLKTVLIKLKTLLAGYNMSVPQAFHNCIIEKQLERTDIQKLFTKAETIQTEVEEVKPEEPKEVVQAAPTLVGSVLTHPDGAVYTFGTRGRRPLWVQDWLKTNAEPSVVPAVETVKEEEPQFILKGLKLTSPDGEKYKFGKRGRRPLWVQEWLKTNKEPEA
jgi:hypothetical protein